MLQTLTQGTGCVRVRHLYTETRGIQGKGDPCGTGGPGHIWPIPSRENRQDGRSPLASEGTPSPSAHGHSGSSAVDRASTPPRTGGQWVTCSACRQFCSAHPRLQVPDPPGKLFPPKYTDEVLCWVNMGETMSSWVDSAGREKKPFPTSQSSEKKYILQKWSFPEI